MTTILRSMRLLFRLSILFILIITASATWHYAPKPQELPVKETLIAPSRTAEEFFPQTLGKWIRGGPVSVSLLDFELTDPFLGLISAISLPSSTRSVILAIFVPVLFALILGRVFCGYLCPVGWLATLLAGLRRRAKNRLPSLNLPISPVTGRILLATAIILSIAGFESIFSLTLVHLHLQNLASHLGEPDVIWSAAGVVFAFLLFDLLVAPGSWCKLLCPSGVVLGLLAGGRLFGISKNEERKCPRSCRICNEHCWLHLSPRDLGPGPACDLCLSCAKSCPQQKLSLKPTLKLRLKKTFLLILFVTAAFFLALAYPSVAGASPKENLPRIDANPPWSIRISTLDYEKWISRGKVEAGVSISFVERVDGSDMYVFSAAVSGAKKDVAKQGPARFVVNSDGFESTLDMKTQNAPRSTIKRAIYSGRIFVEPGKCNRLDASFPDYDIDAQLLFPEPCRVSISKQFLSGFFGWLTLVLILVVLSFLIERWSSRRSGIRDTTL